MNPRTPENNLIDEVYITMLAYTARRSAAGEDVTIDRILVENSLRERTDRVVRFNDMADLESMLTCQAHLLHQLFTEAISKYAAASRNDDSEHFSRLAFRAQASCRHTIGTLNTVKSREVVLQKMLDLENELLWGKHHASLDRGRKATPASPDSWVAAMAK